MRSLDHISVLLVETQSAGNIGSVARAMKNMGLRRLVLVNPQTDLTGEAHHLACGADDVLEKAHRAESLHQALGSFHLSVGTSSRAMDWVPTVLRPAELASRLAEFASEQRIALVFGPERTGLTNEQLQHCQWLATIPTDPNFDSMNLAHAVAIVAYEIRQQLNAQPLGRALQRADLKQVEEFAGGLQRCLDEIGFLNQQNPRQVMFTLRQILSRASLEARDVSILRGILRQWRWYAGTLKSQQ
ncbi:MAG: RNA methyltransferase [Acidobacteria bacterium]|nr:RNA methyltransferase [Acidobacteriota bacterium]MCI0724665.1 RNA methyltransferase [Acidobacteriota bacterium]